VIDARVLDVFVMKIGEAARRLGRLQRARPVRAQQFFYFA
jgi:hypothetical protein